MLICPKCKSEYDEGYTVCSDCGGQLIEQPEIKDEITHEKQDLKIFQFIIGILIILFSTMISYKLTSMYFLENGDGQYIMDQYMWMLNSYQYSFLIIGIIICLPCAICWCKSSKK